MNKDEIRDEIMRTIQDMTADFLYYGRKEDEDLRVGAIEKAVKDGYITVDEIVEEFRVCLSGRGLK